MRTLVAAIAVLALAGCSHLALDRVGDAIAGGGAGFSSDDDPDLVRAAAPFSLKLVESLLAERPRHRGLLLAAARGFTQYAYAFVQQDAEEAEALVPQQTLVLEDRARRLYRRARDYGVRGLALGRPGLVESLRADPHGALAAASPAEVPLLYWSAAAWAGLTGLSKDQPEALADLPIVEALIERALALDEAYEQGAIHTFMIGYAAIRPGGAARSRRHFERAVEISKGRDAAPFVALAESVCVQQQERAQFEALLGRALEVALDDAPQLRLANLVAQRRARWLLSRTDRLFTN